MTPQQIIFLSIVGIALVALIFLSESQKRYNLDSIKRKTVGRRPVWHCPLGNTRGDTEFDYPSSLRAGSVEIQQRKPPDYRRHRR